MKREKNLYVVNDNQKIITEFIEKKEQKSLMSQSQNLYLDE